MTLETLHTAISGLTEDLQAFKEKQEEKLQKLEHKLSCKMNFSESRPGTDVKGYEGALRGFNGFLRKGEYGFEAKSLSRGEVPGSYVVPTPVQERIFSNLEGSASFRSIARVMNISSSSADVIVDTKLPQVGWVGEKEDRPETEAPDLAKINIPVHELYAKPKATQALLDDAAVNLEDWLVQKVTEKMRRFENESFISGNGQKKPKGFLSYETVDQSAWTWGKLEHLKTGSEGSFGDIPGTDVLIDLMSLLKTEYLAGSSWLMSRSAHNLVRKFMDKTSGHHLWQPSLAEGVPSTLLGYPEPSETSKKPTKF